MRSGAALCRAAAARRRQCGRRRRAARAARRSRARGAGPRPLEGAALPRLPERIDRRFRMPISRMICACCCASVSPAGDSDAQALRIPRQSLWRIRAAEAARRAGDLRSVVRALRPCWRWAASAPCSICAVAAPAWPSRRRSARRSGSASASCSRTRRDAAWRWRLPPSTLIVRGDGGAAADEGRARRAGARGVRPRRLSRPAEGDWSATRRAVCVDGDAGCRGAAGDRAAAARRRRGARRPPVGAQRGRSPMLAVALALLLPAAAAGIYLALGAPTLPDEPYAARGPERALAASEGRHDDVAGAMAALEKDLVAHPDDD